MPVATEPKPLTVTQRTAEATREVAETLGLQDLKRVAAALSEAAAEGVRKNTAFAAHVRKLYEEMAPKPAATSTRKRSQAKTSAPDIELIPIKQVEGILNPAAPPDPYFLVDLYGPHQLRLALTRYTPARIREAVAPVKSRSGGARPSGTSRQALIDYIVEHVAGPGY